MKEALLLHYDSLTEFNEKFYEGVITESHVEPQEVSFNKLILPDNDYLENFWGFKVLKDNVKYLIKSHHKDGSPLNLNEELPLKPLKTMKVSYRSEVYHLILDYAKVKLGSEGHISLRECVDRLNSLQHSNPLQRELFIVTILSQYFGRANYRYSTPPGSGKDSIIDTLNFLFGKARTAVNPNTPKLESLSIANKLIALNEVVDLSKSSWKEIEQYLLDVGAFKPEITKRTRKFENVGEFIDIRHLSIALFYNDIDCYNFDIEYFDEGAKTAVTDRFPPLRFYGIIEQDFSEISMYNLDVEIELFMYWYKELIYSLNHWASLKDEYHINNGLDINVYRSMSPRWKINLQETFKWFAMLSKDQEELDSYKERLYDAIEEYNAMVTYKIGLINNGESKFPERNSKVFKGEVFTKSTKEQKVLNLED